MSGALKVTKDRLPDVLKSIRALTKQETLVGIPEEADARDDDSPLGNASLGYIHEFGAPEKNIPARPHLIPGVQSVEDEVAARLKKAAQKALDGSPRDIAKAQHEVGIIATNAVKEKITEGPFVPLAESTIKARARRGRKGAKAYLAAVKSGQEPAEGLVRPLIDTGEYRRSITHVVRPKGK